MYVLEKKMTEEQAEVMDTIKKNTDYIIKTMEAHHLHNSLKAFYENIKLMNEYFFSDDHKKKTRR